MYVHCSAVIDRAREEYFLVANLSGSNFIVLYFVDYVANAHDEFHPRIRTE